MANNPIKPAVRTPKDQFQDMENDRVPWKSEDKMATRFYKSNKLPSKDWMTSGTRCYGDSELDILHEGEK